jgi:hypothetical protein
VLLEKGKLASVAARFDRMMTKVTMEVPMEREGEAGTRTVLHPRKDGFSALVRFPDREIALVDNKTIVHSYDPEGKLIYRKRINEEPKGLEVDPGLDLPRSGYKIHEFLVRRKKELGWVEE